MQETYGVDFDRAMEGEHSAAHVAALASQLPPGARVWVSRSADAVWTLDRMLAAQTYNALRTLMWGMNDRRKRGPAPEPVGPSWLGKTSRSLPALVLDTDELMRRLSLPRR